MATGVPGPIGHSVQLNVAVENKVENENVTIQQQRMEDYHVQGKQLLNKIVILSLVQVGTQYSYVCFKALFPDWEILE